MGENVTSLLRNARPEYCPNPSCPYHDRRSAQENKWFICYGTYYSQNRGPIKRFKCKYCNRTCSTQTFSIDYWTHRHVDYRALDDRLNNCSGYRQIGRSIRVSYSLLKNRILRLARNYLNLFDASLADFPLTEDIAFDGFESFIGSQYTPNNFNIAVGTESLVPYLCSVTLFRRKGRMTHAQKKRRDQLDQLWRPLKDALANQCKKSFRDLISLYLNRNPLSAFKFHTDEKKDYARALLNLTEAKHLIHLGYFSHQTTNSRVARTKSNPLFPINYIDREIRKNSAAHVRETVRFDREINMSISRMMITLGHHAFRKPFKINNIIHTEILSTHADKAGLMKSDIARINYKRLFTHRHLHDHLYLKADWITAIWLMEGKNPPLLTSKGDLAICQPGKGWLARHFLV